MSTVHPIKIDKTGKATINIEAINVNDLIVHTKSYNVYTVKTVNTAEDYIYTTNNVIIYLKDITMVYSKERLIINKKDYADDIVVLHIGDRLRINTDSFITFYVIKKFLLSTNIIITQSKERINFKDINKYRIIPKIASEIRYKNMVTDKDNIKYTNIITPILESDIDQSLYFKKGTIISNRDESIIGIIKNLNTTGFTNVVILYSTSTSYQQFQEYNFEQKALSQYKLYDRPLIFKNK